jgi:hypothetical protein
MSAGSKPRIERAPGTALLPALEGGHCRSQLGELMFSLVMAGLDPVIHVFAALQ